MPGSDLSSMLAATVSAVSLIPCTFLVHAVSVGERDDVPGCEFKSSVCAAATTGCIGKVASKGLLSLISTWIHRALRRAWAAPAPARGEQGLGHGLP